MDCRYVVGEIQRYHILILNIVIISLLSYFPSRTMQEILVHVGLIPAYVGYCCLAANIIQFATDQIHWQYW